MIKYILVIIIALQIFGCSAKSSTPNITGENLKDISSVIEQNLAKLDAKLEVNTKAQITGVNSVSNFGIIGVCCILIVVLSGLVFAVILAIFAKNSEIRLVSIIKSLIDLIVLSEKGDQVRQLHSLGVKLPDNINV